MYIVHREKENKKKHIDCIKKPVSICLWNIYCIRNPDPSQAEIIN